MNEDLEAKEQAKTEAQIVMFKAMNTYSELTRDDLQKFIAYQDKYLQDEGSVVLHNYPPDTVQQIFFHIWKRAKELDVPYQVPEHIDMSVLFEPDPANIEKATITHAQPSPQGRQK